MQQNTYFNSSNKDRSSIKGKINTEHIGIRLIHEFEEKMASNAWAQYENSEL